MQPHLAHHGEVFSKFCCSCSGFVNISKNRSPSPFRLRRRPGLHPSEAGAMVKVEGAAAAPFVEPEL